MSRATTTSVNKRGDGETRAQRLRREFNNIKITKKFMAFERSLRERQDGRCYYCASELYTDRTLEYPYPADWWDEGGPLFGYATTFIDRDWYYHIDHKRPLAKDGTNDLDNLVLACAPCNISKGTKCL